MNRNKIKNGSSGKDRTEERKLADVDSDKSDFHYSTKDYEFVFDKGLNEEVVRKISKIKKEPEWMTDFRLKAFKEFEKRPIPSWCTADLNEIDFDNIVYYTSRTKGAENDWKDVPDDVKKTFDRLGIPEAERKFLSGAGAQYDSEVVYHHIKKELEKQGVLFLGMDDGLKQFPEIVRKYFGTVVPFTDNKFAALNSAVWSGGSFIYIPKNIEVKMPLQAYFRINSPFMGQFERTLIIADKGSKIHYVEGCFTKEMLVLTDKGIKTIEEIKKNDKVLTHNGKYKKVYHTQARPYSGYMHKIYFYGDSSNYIEATKEHPFLYVKREKKNERNKKFNSEFVEANKLKTKDYLVMPINKTIISRKHYDFEFEMAKRGKQKALIKKRIKITKDFFKLIGYFLSEGSVDRGYYTSFSFNVKEKEYVSEIKRLLNNCFGIKKTYESIHKTNNGISVVVSSAEVTRIMNNFGVSADSKKIPEWAMLEDPKKQAELIKALFFGDGNYYNKKTKHGRKEIFRINTVSETLAKQLRDLLLRQGIVSAINKQDRSKENRKTMYVVCIGGEFAEKFGKLVGIKVKNKLNNKKRATMFSIDKNYAYFPIKKIIKRKVSSVPVYNFSVESDESYTVNGAAVHNCTAPRFSSQALHSAVVEVIAMEGAQVKYTTIQNWSNNVYNLVTKRAFAYKNSTIEWVDGNLGSKVTMKYPAIYLLGDGAKGEITSVAIAGEGQLQDAGAKIKHFASNTASKIISKSISKDGGRSSYRGLLEVAKGCKNVKSNVTCDALLLDDKSRTDTYPSNKIFESSAETSHEATVGRIGEEQLFYLTSRGIPETEALSLIVMGFIQPFSKHLPMEYAVELNRLVEMEMENSVG